VVKDEMKVPAIEYGMKERGLVPVSRGAHRIAGRSRATAAY
jgi:hypothetical protein